MYFSFDTLRVVLEEPNQEEEERGMGVCGGSGGGGGEGLELFGVRINFVWM